MTNLQVKQANDSYIGFSTTSSMVEYIDNLSEQNKTSRSEIIRAIIRAFQEQNAQSQ